MYLVIMSSLEIDGSVTFMFILIFGGLICLFAYLYKTMESNKLTLTNKRIYGTIKLFLSKQEINIPLERVDNIVVNKSVFSTGILIMSNNLRKNIKYVSNAKEFCDTTIEEIEKYKNSL